MRSAPAGSAPGIRERNRAAVEAEILAVGKRQLAQVGAAALSLRAVARELGMVPSALYRYVAGRDDLLTLLIVAAYDDLADAVDAALAGTAEDRSGDPRTGFLTIATTARRWALANPHEYALLFGSPVPGYAAPAERTSGPGTRVDARLLELFDGVAPPRLPGLDPAVQDAGSASLAGLLGDPLLAGRRLPPTELLRGITAWTLVLGAVSSELFQHHGPDLAADPEAHFAAVVDLAAAMAFPSGTPSTPVSTGCEGVEADP